jgi:5-methyltetrahydropteroyltriglutamate--homocysteine methyltransferase
MPAIARADVVGSLLRPLYLREAHEAGRKGKLGEEEVRAAEDRAVLEAIALQEAAGIDAVSDGEFRRPNFVVTMGVREAEDGVLDGFATVSGGSSWLDLWKLPDGTPGLLSTNTRSVVVDKIRPRRDIAADEFPFLGAHTTTARAKYTFPAPSWHRVAWEQEHSADAYPRVDDFLEEMGDYVRGVVRRLIAAGCDYIQLDAPNYTQWHCDPKVREVFASWGRDLDAELVRDAELDNSVFDGLTGVTRGIHLCRGNGPQGRWFADGGYGRIAAELFPRLDNYDALLLEYDSPRAGGFEPLANVREDQVVVLGLVSTKVGKLEDAGQVKARIAEAAKVVPLERLALSPQCGFASGEMASTTRHDEQEAKLRLVGRLADEMWPNG